MTFPPDDEHGELLRRALRAEADSVVPSPEGLEIIRGRIARRGLRNLFWWRIGASLAGAALVASAAVMLVPDLRTQVVEITGLSQTTSGDDGERDTSSITRPPASPPPAVIVVPSIGGTRAQPPSPTPTPTPTPHRTGPSARPSPSKPDPCPSTTPAPDPDGPAVVEPDHGVAPLVASSCPPEPTAQPPVPVPTVTTAPGASPSPSPPPQRPTPRPHSPAPTPVPAPTPSPSDTPTP
ncbi:hypothetical protein ACFHYQ_03050 [Sphaerimonospora cavernae]|uniref:Uncharacterized protein n=1 Tax=Sphaerimonospora cavernae TaxID=1740611 RepID=A0ABV6TZR6_9ACTN